MLALDAFMEGPKNSTLEEKASQLYLALGWVCEKHQLLKMSQMPELALMRDNVAYRVSDLL